MDIKGLYKRVINDTNYTEEEREFIRMSIKSSIMAGMWVNIWPSFAKHLDEEDNLQSDT